MSVRTAQRSGVRLPGLMPRLMPRLMLASMLLVAMAVAPLSTLWAHDPIVIDSTVAVGEQDSDTVTVTIRMRQAAVLAALGSTRSLFRTHADLERHLDRVGAYLVEHTLLTADGTAVALVFQGEVV